MKQPPKRNNEDFIQSASVTAMMRALLSNDQGLLKNPDYIAKYFVSSPWSSFLDNPEESKKTLESRVPGCMYYHLVRTKKFDQLLLRWKEKNNVGQVIILGSGLDSRSIRLAQNLTSIRFYEFDLQGMFSYKTDIINSHKELSGTNDNVTYVPINFHEDSLREKFEQTKLDRNLPTFVLWEGVTYFLNEDTVSSTLALLYEYFSNRLSVVFDYAYEDYINGNHDYYGASDLARELEEIGEPHVFGVTPDQVQSFVASFGYHLVENSKSNDLEEEFLKENGKRLAKVHGFHGIAHCEM